MILAIDVHYKDRAAKSAAGIFTWNDTEAKETLIDYTNDIEEYIPGEFYKRELPCLLKIIEKVDISKLEAIIIDGYVYIDNNKNFGLGGYLWEALKEQIPIIGVAKNYYHNNADTVKQVFRGNSKKPLYISCIGLELEMVSELILSMQGEYRIPGVLKQLDILTKEE